MRIFQICRNYKRNISEGVFNALTAMDSVLKKLGYETEIISNEVTFDDLRLGMFHEDDVVFYHLYTEIEPAIRFINCKKVLIFQNITTPELLDHDETMRSACASGSWFVLNTHNYFDCAITFSEYSKSCLVQSGWEENRVHAIPILMRFDALSIEPDADIVNRYSDGSINILFSGRVFPTKRQENIIESFASYHNKYNHSSRLFIVGSDANHGYYLSLKKYIHYLGMDDYVIFTGRVRMSKYLAYYRVASTFLCLSDHEGFCMPLVEAMQFEVPIIYFKCTAVTDTMNGSGVAVTNRNPEQIAYQINKLVIDDEYRKSIISSQRKRLNELDADNLIPKYQTLFEKIIGIPKKSDGNDILKHPFGPDYAFNVKKRQEPEGFEYISFGEELLSGIYSLVRDRALDDTENVIIYGAGKIGRELYWALNKYTDRLVIMVCDSYKNGTIDGIDTDVLTIESASQIPASLFLISVQNRGGSIRCSEDIRE